MAVTKRKTHRLGQHASGSSTPRVGRPRKAEGKAIKRVKGGNAAATKARVLKCLNAKLVAALALQTGESMDFGVTRVALLVALQLIEDADLVVDADQKKVKGLDKHLANAARLCSTTLKTLKLVFWAFVESQGETIEVTDNTTRGRGGVDVKDRASMHKTYQGQVDAIKAFIKYRHDGKGSKVRHHHRPAPPHPTPTPPHPNPNPGDRRRHRRVHARGASIE